MKWLALLFLVANAVLIFAGLGLDSGNRQPGQEQDLQRLPRVADLRPVEEIKETVPPVAMVSVDGPGSSEDDDAAESPGCMRLGWFDTRQAAEAFRERNLPNSQISEIDRQLTPLHWVLIPPRPEEQALQLFRRLQREGVDSYLVMEGPNRNAISLGLFRNLDAALRVLNEKKSQNLNAVLAKFPRNQISYALDFRVAQASAPGDLEALAADAELTLEMLDSTGCEGVATAEKTP